MVRYRLGREARGADLPHVNRGAAGGVAASALSMDRLARIAPAHEAKAVDDDMLASVFTGNGLIARAQVDDAQPRVPEPYAAIG